MIIKHRPLPAAPSVVFLPDQFSFVALVQERRSGLVSLFNTVESKTVRQGPAPLLPEDDGGLKVQERSASQFPREEEAEDGG